MQSTLHLLDPAELSLSLICLYLEHHFRLKMLRKSLSNEMLVPSDGSLHNEVLFLTGKVTLISVSPFHPLWAGRREAGL